MSSIQEQDKELLNDRRKTTIAILLSLLFHLLLISTVGVIVASHRATSPKKHNTQQPIEVTLMPPEAPPQKPSYIATTEQQRAQKPPEHPDFISDKDTVAATEKPATGTAPLPSTEGVKQPDLVLQNQNYTPGKLNQTPAPAQKPVNQTQTQPQKPQQKQQQQQKPDEEQPQKQETAGKASPTPTPDSKDVQLLEAPKPHVTAKQPTPVVQPPRPQIQVPPSLPGYQPMTRTAHIQGSLSNRGRVALNARATPLGRYQKQLSDAIGSRWYYYVNDQAGLVNVGSIDIQFTVDRSGTVHSVRVLSNTSNESFAACSVRAIMDAEIPPIPDDVARALDAGRIEIDYTFTILPN